MEGVFIVIYVLQCAYCRQFSCKTVYYQSPVYNIIILPALDYSVVNDFLKTYLNK